MYVHSPSVWPLLPIVDSSSYAHALLDIDCVMIRCAVTSVEHNEGVNFVHLFGICTCDSFW